MNKKDWNNPELNVLGLKDTANYELKYPCDYCTTKHYTEDQKRKHNEKYHSDQIHTS